MGISAVRDSVSSITWYGRVVSLFWAITAIVKWRFGLAVVETCCKVLDVCSKQYIAIEDEVWELGILGRGRTGFLTIFFAMDRLGVNQVASARCLCRFGFTCLFCHRLHPMSSAGIRVFVYLDVLVHSVPW